MSEETQLKHFHNLMIGHTLKSNYRTLSLQEMYSIVKSDGFLEHNAKWKEKVRQLLYTSTFGNVSFLGKALFISVGVDDKKYFVRHNELNDSTLTYLKATKIINSTSKLVMGPRRVLSNYTTNIKSGPDSLREYFIDKIIPAEGTDYKEVYDALKHNLAHLSELGLVKEEEGLLKIIRDTRMYEIFTSGVELNGNNHNLVYIMKTLDISYNDKNVTDKKYLEDLFNLFKCNELNVQELSNNKAYRKIAKTYLGKIIIGDVDTSILSDDEVRDIALSGSSYSIKSLRKEFEILDSLSKIEVSDEELAIEEIKEMLDGAVDYTFEKVMSINPPRKNKSTGKRKPTTGSSQKDKIDKYKKQLETGNLAEEIVLEYERNRLLKIDRPDLSEKVCILSGENESDDLGFDLVTFNKDGSTKNVEVKINRKKKGASFFLSVNQLNKLEKGMMSIYLVNPEAKNISELDNSMLKQLKEKECINPIKFQVNFN